MRVHSVIVGAPRVVGMEALDLDLVGGDWD